MSGLLEHKEKATGEANLRAVATTLAVRYSRAGSFGSINDSYEPSGSGGSFHWQAYFHQYQNLRPGTVLPKPPKPNAAPAANAGPSAPTQQSWANWAYHGISAAGEWIYDNASFLGHIALDLAGLIPVIGNAADLLNASWYTWEGDYTNAALSSASAVIGVGIGVTAVKYGNIILQTLPLNAVKNVADNIGTFVGDTLTGAQKLLADQSGAIDVTRLYDGMEWVIAKFTGWGPFGRGVAPTTKGGLPSIRTGKWGQGSFGSATESLQEHFAKHGPEVGAQDIDQYLRKAEDFARNLRGAAKSTVTGATPDVTRYKKLGKYIDIDRHGNIISFGLQ